MIPKSGYRFSDKIMRQEQAEKLGFSGLIRLRWRTLGNAFEVW